MSTAAILLALFAAVLHASWNAFLRNGKDRLRTVTVMSLAGTAIALACVPFLSVPAASAWGYILFSALLQVGYSLFLVTAYRHGDLGQVYPIVRGTVPLLVTFGAFFLTGDTLTAYQVAGVLLVALGIMSLSLGRDRATTASIAWAIATGTIVAGYGMVDSVGVRLSGDSTAYTAWVLVIYGTLLPSVYVLIRGRLSLDFHSRDEATALAGGLVAMIAYGSVVAAFALAPAGPITALRETSVVFALLIGWGFLGERLTIRRFAACIVVAAGAICLSL